MKTPRNAQLHRAATAGDLYALQQLLDSGRCDVDCGDEAGITPLMKAASAGHRDACILLIDEGADVNAVKPDGVTALMFAAQNGHTEVVELLLREGARPDMRTKEGGSALLSAAQSGQTASCRALLTATTTTTTTTTAASASANDDGSGTKACLEARLTDGANAAFLAAQNGHTDTLAVLADAGCPLGLARNDGTSALWIACQLGHVGVVRELLRRGQRDEERPEGTGLFKACQKGHEAVVGVLLGVQQSQSPHPQLALLQNGESVLHAAALFGNLSVAKQLLAAGSDPKLTNRFGETPLDLALQMNYEEIVQLLRKSL